jgi:hypothetical protein
MCSTAAVVAHEFEVPASGDMAHAQISKRRDAPLLALADLDSLVLAGAVRRGCATREQLPGDHRVTVLWLLPIERDSPRRSLACSAVEQRPYPTTFMINFCGEPMSE